MTASPSSSKGFRLSDMNRTIVLSVQTGGTQDVTKSRVLWKETKGVPEVPSPLIWQGRVYLIRSGGLLVCRDLEKGALIYENRIGFPGGYFASPTLAGGCLYLASDRGRSPLSAPEIRLKFCRGTNSMNPSWQRQRSSMGQSTSFHRSPVGGRWCVWR